MFNKKKIENLESRIDRLERLLETKPDDRIEIATDYISFNGRMSWIMCKGEVSTLDNGLSTTERHKVSAAYILDAILDHLKLDIVLNREKDADLCLQKRKPIKKQRQTR